MRSPIACALAAVLLAGSGLATSHGERGVPPAPGTHASPTPDDDGRGTPYKVDRADNVCGLDEPRALTNPAKVDFQALIEATPEVAQIKKKKIDRDSAEGIRLLTEARTRVLRACETVRGTSGHCSVWKQITRRDGKAVDDITDQVRQELDKTPPAAGTASGSAA